MGPAAATHALGLTLALAVLGSALQAQDARPPGPPVIPIGVDLVRVDVVVTDRAGRHVADLRPEEVTIEEDGRPRTIAAMRYVTTGLPAAPLPAAAAPSMPAAEEARAPTEPRSMVIVLDDVTFSAESRTRVPRVIGQIIDERAGPDMPVAIIRTGGGIAAGQDFTADKTLLRAVLSHLRPAPGGTGGVRGDTMEAEQRVQMTLQMLRNMEALVAQLAERPGRKTLLIVSEGMGLASNVDVEGVRGLDQLRRLTDAANRAGVTISTVEPSGLVSGLSGNSASSHADPFTTSAMLRDQLNGQLLNATAQRLSLRRGPEQLAAETGGVALADSNDIRGAVERAWDDQDGYYLIGYEPEAVAASSSDGESVEHHITVRVKRKDLTVRARRVYYVRAAEPGPAVP